MASDVRHLFEDSRRRTPEHVLAMAREVMGEIDLDPASDVEAQERVKATHWHGHNPTDVLPNGWLSSDGLVTQWHGRVWLNPPGGMLDKVTLQPKKGGKAVSSMAVWWAKLLHEFEAGRVSEFLFLSFTLEGLLNTQKWGPRPLQSFPFCVPSNRLEFSSSNGRNTSQPAAGSAIAYAGPNVARFVQVFSRIGHVCVPERQQ